MSSGWGERTRILVWWLVWPLANELISYCLIYKRMELEEVITLVTFQLSLHQSSCKKQTGIIQQSISRLNLTPKPVFVLPMIKECFFFILNSYRNKNKNSMQQRLMWYTKPYPNHLQKMFADLLYKGCEHSPCPTSIFLPLRSPKVYFDIFCALVSSSTRWIQ